MTAVMPVPEKLRHVPAWYLHVAPVREHLDTLRAGGMGTRAIEVASGVSRPVIFRIVRGRQTWVNPLIARKLLKVTLDAALKVPAVGSTRRLQALAAIGYDARTLSLKAGLGYDTILELQAEHVAIMFADTAAAVRRLYDELSDRPVTGTQQSTYARTVARRDGWAPPIAWDDDIDDSAARPQLPADRKRSTREVCEEATHLIRGGVTFEQAAERLGIEEKSLRRAFERSHLPIPKGA